MKPIFLALTAIATTSASAANAQEASPMQGAFGNTMVSVQPNGSTSRTYIDPDGTYRSVTDGYESAGRWEVKKGKICYNATSPVPAPPLCALGPNKKVGDKWKIYISDDASVQVQIVAGRP